MIKATFNTINIYRNFLYLLIFSLLNFEISFAFSNAYSYNQTSSFKKKFKNYSVSNINQLQSVRIIVQDKYGIVYAGNFDNFTGSGCIHQFDGVSWRVFKGPNTGIYSIALDEDETIFIGGFNQIGYLKPTSNGIMKYESLVELLGDNNKDFADVYFAHSTKDGIYFTSKKYLFRYNQNSKKIKVWQSLQGEEFLSSFLYKDKFYIQKNNIGLLYMENEKLKLVPNGDIFKDKTISMMVPFNTQNILVGTRNNGFYLFDGSSFNPFPTDADVFFKENLLIQGIRLSCSDFALATFYGGLIIIDSNGIIKEIFDKSYGLQDSQVLYVYEDMEGNLWLAMETGISKIEYISPISINDDLSLYFMSIVKNNGVLYVGTEWGLFYLLTNGKFHHVPNTSAYYSALLSLGDSIFATSNKGVHQFVRNKKKVIIDDGLFFSILHSQIDKNRIWVGGLKGLLSLYKKNGMWQKERHFENISQRIESIVEDKKGNLWLGVNGRRNSSENIVLKVDFPGDGTISPAVVTGYTITPQELSHNACWVFKIASHIIFSTEKGLFRFDKRKKAFFPDLTLGSSFAGDLKTKEPLFLIEDKNKNIWFRSKIWMQLAKHISNGSYSIQSKPFKRIKSFYWFPIYPDPNENITWIGNKGKLIRYDNTIKKNYNTNFHTLIRKVLASGKIVFDGNGQRSEKDLQSKDSLPIIPYSDRNLRFEFAAPFFTDENKTQYRYLLEGYNKKWSEWGGETKKEYTTLKPGLYCFRAQSKNVYQHPGKEAAFQFRILLPWYRTWWAFFSYLIVFIVFTYLIVKWRRSFQLEREKQKLEQTVSERTKEIKVKNQQLEEQSEKLMEMDKVKSRFFANISHEFRTPLTLIMGPLEQILSHDHKNLEKKASIALQNSQRLLSLINQLLDLSKLDSGKMKLQASLQNIIPFLKEIISTFEPVIEEKDLELSFQSEKESITLYFDPEKLEHVILNILANAVKFTPSGGKIMIRVTEIGINESDFPMGSLAISVSDTGPGIPRHELSNIFDRFYQSSSTYEKNPKGSGIGLALAKELVELHYGELDTNSSEGKGTEFIIQLPMGASHLKADEMIKPLEKPYNFKNLNEHPTYWNIKKENQPNVDIIEARDEDKLGTEDNLSTIESDKNIILVVEDSVELRDYVKDSLEPLYEVFEAKNGREGIQKAQEIIPDLIISDIMMPEVDGYELCRQLKKHIKTCHIPIILLTAKASEESVLEGLEIGADDYITKPFSTKILCARIKNLIELRRQSQLKRKRQMTLQPVEIASTSMDEEFYKELQEVIEKNLSDSEFSVNQLARSLYLGRSTLYRKLMALTGETPRQVIQTYRLKRAAQLLKTNFGNITQVAQEVGFSNMAYFTQCFKKEFHQLPSTYQSSESK